MIPAKRPQHGPHDRRVDRRIKNETWNASKKTARQTANRNRLKVKLGVPPIVCLPLLPSMVMAGPPRLIAR